MQQTAVINSNNMGAVYRKVEPRKQKGRFIYNRDRLHKVGWKPKHKQKYIILHKEFIDTVKNYCL